MEGIGIGDLHFDKLDSLIPNASELIVKSVERVFRYALNNGVKNVLFYGDIGERPRLSYDAQVNLYKLLLKKKYRDLSLHFILGNHDFAENGTHTLQVIQSIANEIDREVYIYTKPELKSLDGVPFNFLPYPFTETTKKAINVGHFEVKGSIRDNGKKIEEGPSSKHNTLMGHLHTCHRVNNTYYSGTLYQTNFGEHLPKSFHHFKAHSASELHVDNIAFEPPWKLLNLTVSSERDLEDLDSSPNVLYKLFLKDGADVDIDYVLTKYPNIVKHNVFKSKKELEEMVQQAWELDAETVTDVVNVDYEAVVYNMLKEEGHSDKEVKRAMFILKNLQGLA